MSQAYLLRGALGYALWLAQARLPLGRLALRWLGSQAVSWGSFKAAKIVSWLWLGEALALGGFMGMLQEG